MATDLREAMFRNSVSTMTVQPTIKITNELGNIMKQLDIDVRPPALVWLTLTLVNFGLDPRDH